MRRFHYVTLDELGVERLEVVTEEQIKENYFPGWKLKMKGKYPSIEWGFEDCLQDWMTTNWAWEVK